MRKKVKGKEEGEIQRANFPKEKENVFLRVNVRLDPSSQFTDILNVFPETSTDFKMRISTFLTYFELQFLARLL